MDKQTLRRADLVFSYALMLLSTWFFIMSIKLFFNPFSRDFKKVSAEDIKLGIIEWYKSPALLPLLLCILIFISALMLMHKARKDGAKLDFLKKDRIIRFLKNKELRVASGVIAVIAAYVFFIIPICRENLDFFPRFQGFPFMIATFIFLSMFIVAFNEKNMKKIAVSLVVAGISAVAITYGFGTLALIPLP